MLRHCSGLIDWYSHGSRLSQPAGPLRAGRLWWVLGIMLSALAWSGLNAAEESDDARAPFGYVAPQPGEPFDAPPLTSVPLSEDIPEGITEEVEYRGTKRRYAQLRYGTPNSTRVVIVIDERDGGQFDVYVDRNRNRIIEAKDLVEGEGRVRRTPLETEVYEDDIARRSAREVVLRRDITGRSLGYATAGYVEGVVTLAGRDVAVRRVDADGNGFFADDRDRLWLDLDGDRQWNAFTEQFPFQPVLRLGDQRFAVRSDATGAKLSLDEIVGTGTFRLALQPAEPQAHVTELTATLIGDDGSAVAIRGAEEAVTVPVGRYAFLSVSVTLTEPGTNKPWRFTFARSGQPAENHWHAVAADEAVSADPIGEFRFALEGNDLAKAARPGATLSVSPRLYTEEGLLITTSSCGEQKFASTDNSNCATVRLCLPGTTGAAALDQYQSGFA